MTKTSIYKGGTRRFVDCSALWEKMRDDYSWFENRDDAEFLYRPATDTERSKAKQYDKEPPSHVCVVPCGLGLIRIGWDPIKPTWQELESVEFEPGVRLPAILRGADAAIKRNVRAAEKRARKSRVEE